MKKKFIQKYMRMAKQVGEDNNPCCSRHIGSVIVRIHEDESGSTFTKVLGTGYNGPPVGVPHNTDRGYLRQVFWPQLTVTEKAAAASSAGCTLQGGHSDESLCDIVCDKYADAKICPRKIVNAPSGKRLELCSCAHSETNAIINASDDLYGAYMFAYCGVPCAECTKLIINAGIKKVFVIDWGADYSPSSRWMFEKAGVEIIMQPPEWYLSENEE